MIAKATAAGQPHIQLDQIGAQFGGPLKAGHGIFRGMDSGTPVAAEKRSSVAALRAARFNGGRLFWASRLPSSLNGMVKSGAGIFSGMYV